MIKPDLTLTKDEKPSKISNDLRGVYVIYSKTGVLLYVGRSTYLQERVRAHLRGYSHIKEFYRLFERAEIFCQQTISELGFSISEFERFLIKKLKPPINKKGTPSNLDSLLLLDSLIKEAN